MIISQYASGFHSVASAFSCQSHNYMGLYNVLPCEVSHWEYPRSPDLHADPPPASAPQFFDIASVSDVGSCHAAQCHTIGQGPSPDVVSEESKQWTDLIRSLESAPVDPALATEFPLQFRYRRLTQPYNVYLHQYLSGNQRIPELEGCDSPTSDLSWLLHSQWDASMCWGLPADELSLQTKAQRCGQCIQQWLSDHPLSGARASVPWIEPLLQWLSVLANRCMVPHPPFLIYVVRSVGARVSNAVLCYVVITS